MVIQRWQSVLLLFAAIVMGIFSFSEISQIVFYDFDPVMTDQIVSADSYTQKVINIGNDDNVIVSTYYFFALSILSSLLSLISIFLYKNLNLQKRLCKINILLYIVIYIVVGVISYILCKGSNISWYYSIAYPAVALLLTVFAYRQICKDEKKLRSYDRIR